MKNAQSKSVDTIYEKKSLKEHVLLRPDTYIGSVEPCTDKMWDYDKETNRVVQETITYTPGMYKIFGKARLS